MAIIPLFGIAAAVLFLVAARSYQGDLWHPALEPAQQEPRP
jgi:hypothetical protein